MDYAGQERCGQMNYHTLKIDWQLGFKKINQRTQAALSWMKYKIKDLGFYSTQNHISCKVCQTNPQVEQNYAKRHKDPCKGPHIQS